MLCLHARWWPPWAERGTLSTLCAPIVRRRSAPRTSLSGTGSLTARRTTTTCFLPDAITVMGLYWMLVMHSNTNILMHLSTVGGCYLLITYKTSMKKNPSLFVKQTLTVKLADVLCPIMSYQSQLLSSLVRDHSALSAQAPVNVNTHQNYSCMSCFVHL